MALTRRMLKEMGLEQEQIDRIMDAHGGQMADMVTKAEAEEQGKSLVEKAKQEWEKALPKAKGVEDFEEYQALKKELDGIKRKDFLRAAKVLDKYSDIVAGRIDWSDPDKSIKDIKQGYAEFFAKDEEQGDEQPKEGTAPKVGFPAFSAPAGASATPDATEEARKQIRKAFGL